MEVQWDTPENVTRAQQKVDYVLNGCKCKTGCHTKRCSCRKNSGPGCRCVGCGNAVSTSAACNDNNEELVSLELGDFLNQGSDSTDDSDTDSEQFERDASIGESDIQNIMSLIFGDDEEDDTANEY